MINDGSWIGLTKLNPGNRERRFRCVPWCVNVLGTKTRKLRHEPAHIVAVRIEYPPLQHGIEDPEIGCRVRAGTSHPLPTGRVVGEVGVDERVPEPTGTLLPGHQEVLGEKRGDDHAHAIVHPAALPELPHAGIDDWITGLTSLSRRKTNPAEFLIRFPRNRRELRPKGLNGDVRPMV